MDQHRTDDDLSGAMDYQICDKRWSNLDVVDLALLADIAYVIVTRSKRSSWV